MPKHKTIRFAPDGSWMVFEPRFPHRGVGLALILCSLLGVFMLVCALMAKSLDETEAVFFPVFGVAATLGFLLPGLYLRTRRMRVRIDAEEVSVERGSCFRRSSRRHKLSEFEGVTKTTKMVGTMDAGTTAATVASMAVGAIVGGAGVVQAKVVPVHVLTLVHRTSRLCDVVLAMHPDAAFVNDVQTALAKNFSLDALTETAHGFTKRSPDEIGKFIVERAAEPAAATQPDAPPLGPSPPKIVVKDRGPSTRIILPGRRMPLVTWITLPGFAFVIAGLCLWAKLFTEDGDKISPMMILVPFLIGSAIAAGLLIVSSLRLEVALRSSGVSYQPAPLVRRHVLVPWASIQDVTVSKAPTTKKLGVRITTNSKDHWIGHMLDAASLDWIRAAILAKAAEVAEAE